MAQMQGAMQMERGLARMWSAGSSEGVKAAYQKSAQQKGAVAAENIRQRFYKKEFEQIMETQVKPLTDSLESAKDAYRVATQVTTMPIERHRSQQERIATSSELNPNIDGAQGPAGAPIPGAPTGGGEGASPPPVLGPDSEIAASNQILAEPTDIEEKIAIRDPISGQPVELSSARGIAIMQEAAGDFGSEFSKTNQSLMEVMSKYSGNPFASRYGEALVDNLAKQAGMMSSGQADPKAQQEWWEQRQKFEREEDDAAKANDRAAELAERQAEEHALNMQTGGQKVELNEQTLQAGADDRADAQAERETAINMGISRAEDGKLDRWLSPDIREKIAKGEGLDEDELLIVADAGKRWEEQQELDWNREQKGSHFKFPRASEEHVSTWMDELKSGGQKRGGNSIYHAKYGAEKARVTNNVIGDFNAKKGTSAEKTSELVKYGATPNEIASYLGPHRTMGDSVAEAFERMAMTPEANAESNLRAAMQTLPGMELKNPRVKAQVDNTIETFIADALAGGQEISEERQEYLRINRHETFWKIAQGGDAPTSADPNARASSRTPAIRAKLKAHEKKWAPAKRQREFNARPRQGPKPAPAGSSTIGSPTKAATAATSRRPDTKAATIGAPAAITGKPTAKPMLFGKLTSEGSYTRSTGGLLPTRVTHSAVAQTAGAMPKNTNRLIADLFSKTPKKSMRNQGSDETAVRSNSTNAPKSKPEPDSKPEIASTERPLPKSQSRNARRNKARREIAKAKKRRDARKKSRERKYGGF